MSETRSSTITIIGGGVIGLMAAWRLAEKGCQVTLFEQGRPGQEATFASLGLLLPGVPGGNIQDDCYARLKNQSLNLYPDLAAQLLQDTHLDVELREEGILDVTLDETELAHFDQIQRLYQTAGIPVDLLTPSEAHTLEPALSSQIKGGLFFKTAKQVENRRLGAALTLAARQAGAEIFSGQAVTGLVQDGDQVLGVTVNGQVHRADRVIVTAGAWSGQIAGIQIPVRPIKGQALAVEAPFVITHTIHNEAGIIVPRRDGRLLIGATVEEAGFDKRSTVEGVYALLSSAMQFFPALKEATILETWAGLRPHAIDGWPILGPVAGYEGLYISTGHFRNGILLAPVTTQLVVDWVLGQSSTMDVSCFSPNRFL